MYCNKCRNKINEEDNFCGKCGQKTIVTSVNTNANQNVNSGTNKKEKNKVIIPIVILIIFILSVIGIFVGIYIYSSAINTLYNNDFNTDFINENNINEDNNYYDSENNNYNNNNTESIINNNEETEVSNNGIKGNYSREVFSNNTFKYNTMYDTATFKFNPDSTFNVTYSSGTTYNGTFEVYNGLYITVKANEIELDTNINNAVEMANDIRNVSNEMMVDFNSMLNVYLLWIKTDTGVLQPFCIKYDPDSNTGTAVNILGKTQGIFNLI